MNNPYQRLDDIVKDSYKLDRIEEKYGFRMVLGGEGGARDDIITFQETHVGGGTYQQALHIPDVWMRAVNASDGQDFCDILEKV